MVRGEGTLTLQCNLSALQNPLPGGPRAREGGLSIFDTRSI
jgi:hypothetical protein